MKTSDEYILRALEYCWINLDETDKAELNLAIDKAWKHHSSIATENQDIIDKIAALFDQYIEWAQINPDVFFDMDEEDCIFAMLEEFDKS